jgi:hypothetical protein
MRTGKFIDKIYLVKQKRLPMRQSLFFYLNKPLIYPIGLKPLI